MRKVSVFFFLLLAVQFTFSVGTVYSAEGEPSVADTIVKPLLPEEFTACCLPFDVDTTLISRLFRVARIDDDGTAYVYPVLNVPAGCPFVAQSSTAIDTFVVAASQIRRDTRLNWMIPWDGGDILCQPQDFSWQYCSMDSVWHAADQLNYIALDPHDLNFTSNLENLPVRRYLHDANYDESSPTVVNWYQSAITNFNIQGDHPNPVTIPVPVEVFGMTDLGRTVDTLVISYRESSSSTEQQTAVPLSDISPSDPVVHIYNLVPQRDYNYEIHAVYGALEFLSRVSFPIVDTIDYDTLIARGSFHTDGHVRMIYAPDIRNIRDLGGRFTTTGRMVKYGKLYRGGELNGLHLATAESVQRLKDIGIQAEIDLRNNQEAGSNISAFGFIPNDKDDPDGLKTYYYTSNSGCTVEHMDQYTYKLRWRRELEYIEKCLKLNRPVYFHCIWGADRTGFLSMLLYGVLGVTYDAIAKDYELTSFTRESYREKASQLKLINVIKELPGETLQEQFLYYVRTKLAVSQSTVDYLTEALLEEEPITLGVTSTSVTSRQHTRCFDLQGRRLETPSRRGIYIKVDARGNSRKIFHP